MHMGPSAHPPDTNSSYEITEDRGVHVVTLLRSEILEPEIPELRTSLERYFEGKPRAKAVLDLHVVSHIGAPALSMLLRLNTVIKQADGVLLLANVRDQLQEVLRVTRLNEILKIKPSTDEAVASLSVNPS